MFISESKRSYNAKPSAYYFYVRTKISAEFYICISVPLILFMFLCLMLRLYQAGIYLFKVNNRNTRTMREICSNLTIKRTSRTTSMTMCWRQWWCDSNREYQISYSRVIRIVSVFASSHPWWQIKKLIYGKFYKIQNVICAFTQHTLREFFTSIWNLE